MSGFSVRAIALSLACVVVMALPADAAHRGGGGGGGGGGGHGGGGGGFRGGGGGGGGAHFSAPAFHGGGGGGATFVRPSFSGVRSFGGMRTFARPMISGRSFSRPVFRGSRLTYSSRGLRSGRFFRGSRFAGRSRLHGRSARLGLRNFAGRRGGLRSLHGRRTLAGRSFGRHSLASRSLGRRSLGRRSLASRSLAANRQIAARTNTVRAAAQNRSGRLASAQAFGRSDWRRSWRNHRGLYYGWVGPLFWPYAYDDLFYDAFWDYGLYGPDDYYDDPFWAYGYGDIYGGLFSPYGYDDLAGGASPRALAIGASPRARLARQSTGGDDVSPRGGERGDGERGPPSGSVAPSRWKQMCGDDTRDVVGLPIDRIQEIVQPSEAQRAALDQLGDASVKAAQAVKAACPSDYSLTPTGRLATMEQRLQAMRQAVDIIRPPLDAFFNSLTDEQKARLTAAGQRDRAGREQRAFAQDCSTASSAIEWPTGQIDRMVRPTSAQRASLDRLRDAAAKAADLLKSSCPSQTPATPPARLAAMATRLDVMIETVRTVRAAADEFYRSLTDEQKAQFNTIGQARAAQ